MLHKLKPKEVKDKVAVRFKYDENLDAYHWEVNGIYVGVVKKHSTWTDKGISNNRTLIDVEMVVDDVITET